MSFGVIHTNISTELVSNTSVINVYLLVAQASLFVIFKISKSIRDDPVRTQYAL